jgi:diguanylate cyclase (GGDEF)-like protein/PAS domain S-box-containing protein
VDVQGRARLSALRKYLIFTAVPLAASLLWLGITVFSLARDTRFVRQSSAQRQIISDGRTELQTVLISLNNAETAQRGYLLTGKDSYLAPYRNDVIELPALLHRLGNLDRQAMLLPSSSIAQVQRNVGMKLDEMAETIRLAQGGKRAAAVALVTTDEGQRLMERLRADIDALTSTLNAEDRAAADAIVQSIGHRERSAVFAAYALLISLTLAGTQVALLFAAQRRFQLALAASEQRHRALVDEQAELIALVQPDGSLFYTNPAFARFFGVSTKSLQGGPFLEWVLPADRTAMQSALGDAFAAPNAIAIESRVLAADGQERWISWRLRLQQGSNASPAVHAVGRDVTLRKTAEASLRASEDFLRRTGRVAGIGGWEWNLTTGQLHWSAQVRRILEVNDDYMPTIDEAFDFFAEGAREKIRRAMDEARFRGTSWDLELPVIPASGHRIYVRAVGEAEFDEDGIPFRIVGTLQDVTDRHELEQQVEANFTQLARQTAMLNTIIEAIPAMVAVFDRDMRYLLVNKGFERWQGRGRTELIGRSANETMDPEEYELSRAWAERALAGETVSFEREYPGAVELRHVSLTYLPLRLDDDSIVGFFGVAQDITRHREENLRLMLLAERDALTGLLNRAGFEEFMETKVRRGEASALAVIYIDLDHFKPVNDTYGHSAGDKVLCEFALRLLHLVRPVDAVARLGGDEFAVVLSSVRCIEDAGKVAEEIVDMARQPFSLGETKVSIGASVGVACDAGGGWKSLVESADAMAYRAKAAGRGGFALADEEYRQSEHV